MHAGKVPGVVTAHEASPEAPAARVRLYVKTGGGYAPTEVYLAQPAGQLTTIDELPEPAATEAVAGSFDDIREIVEDAIRDRIEELTGENVPVWVRDIGPGWAVYERNWDGCMWQVSYEISADGTVTLGAPIEVFRVTTYVPDTEGGEQPTTVAAATEAVTEHGRVLAAGVTDPDGGRVFRVQLLQYGTSKNGNHYPRTVMEAAVPLYEGAKAYDRHRTQTDLVTSTVAGLIGTYRGVAATDVGLEADLHLLPSATHIAEALDMSLANQSQGLPPLVGISHDVFADWRQAVIGGRTVREAMSIRSVNSADVIADPSAGGKALRMVAGGPADDPTSTNTTMTNSRKEFPVTLKQLLELLRAAESAKRPALLTEHTRTIESFGLTVDEFTRLVEAEPAAPAAPVRSTEAVNVKGSALADLVIDGALKKANLDPTRFSEAVSDDLADQFTDADLAKAIDRVKRLAEAAQLAPTVSHVEVTKDQRTRQVEALDQMLDPRSAKGFRSLKEAFIEITGAQPRDLFAADFNHRLLRECVNVGSTGEILFDSDLRGTESVSTSTFGYILGDSITRRMIAEYMQPNLQNWRQIVSSIVPITDFRTQKIEAMGGYGTLPTVAQGAPYNPLTTPGNEESTYALAKRGGTEDLTIETIANDDLRAVQRIPVKLGLAAAQTLFRFVWDFIITNPTLTRDSTALFAAGHANTTTTALSSTALETSRTKMRKQAAYGDSSDILSLIPKFLVTVPELEALAWQLCTSAVAIPSGAPVGAASNQPNLHQGMTPIILDYWSATSTTFWGLVADPALCPTIELGFLNGQEDPALFVQSDPTSGSVFNTDKVTYKIRHIYGGTVIDHRGFQRGNT